MTDSEIKAYRTLPPACRYLTMALTAMPADLPDGWTHVPMAKLARETRVHELTLRKHLTAIAASGLYELRAVVRNNRQRVDVRPTFIDFADPITAR